VSKTTERDPQITRHRYRYEIHSADDAGERRHPAVVIRDLAPDATELEGRPIGDCWFFLAAEIANPPPFVVVIDDVYPPPVVQ
jgi:hypothetical protein